MAERPGESGNDASDTNNTNSGAASLFACNREAASSSSQANNEARGGEERETCASIEENRRGSSGASVLQAVQAWMVSDCGAYPQRAGHAFCLPVLSEVAPRSRTRARLQEDAACAMVSVAPRGGIEKRWHAR
jgi:hypothetical protein